MTELEKANQRIAALEAQEVELCTLYGIVQAENGKLRADLEAIGAGGVSGPLMGGYSAGDMAAQGAEQFRAGQASTQPVEKWSDRVQRAHPKSEPEFWPDELRLKYMAEEIADLRTAQPDTQVERLKQEIAWLEDAARESEYLRGYRQGYEQRDAEVRGALV